NLPMTNAAPRIQRMFNRLRQPYASPQSPGIPGHLASHYQPPRIISSVPVVLVYLGFLNAHEMDTGIGSVFKDHNQWQACVLDRSRGTIPQAAWNNTFDVDGTPLTVLIRSAAVGIHARLTSNGNIV